MEGVRGARRARGGGYRRPVPTADAHQWAVAHGLEPDDPDDAAYAALTVAWQALLVARRQGGAGR